MITFDSVVNYSTVSYMQQIGPALSQYPFMLWEQYV